MDSGVALTPDEVKGRNMWMVWTGGNDRFWDMLADQQLRRVRPAEDHLLASRACKLQPRQPLELSRPGQRALLRARRPGPIPDRFGLWLDKRRADCPPDPFENEQKYPGVQIGARGKNAAGRVLLRLRHRASSVCGCSRIRTSTRRRRKNWDPGALLHRPELLQLARTWCGRTASACRAASATSGRTRQAAGRSGEPEVGESELQRRRAVLLDRPHLRLGSRPDATSSSSSSTPRGPARSTPRWSRPTTSTTRAR